MEQVSADLLLAAIGGLGDAAGRQVWQELCHMVRGAIPHRRSSEPGGDADELSVLEQQPADRDAAVRLAGMLAARAAADEDFRRELTVWAARTRQLYAPRDKVHNEISGGTFHQPVLQVGVINQVD
jgi:hypothetical protein